MKKKMDKTPSWKKFLSVAITSWSLMISSSPAWAQSGLANPNTVNNIAALMDSLSGLITGAANQCSGVDACATYQPTSEVLQPRTHDGLFPSCPMVKAKTARLNGACEDANNPCAAQQARSCRAKSIQMVEMLEQFQSTSQNSNGAPGNQCLMASKNNAMNRIDEMRRRLTKNATAFEALAQKFKEDQKLIKRSLDDMLGTLHGSDKGLSAKGLSRDFTKDVGQDCADIFAKEGETFKKASQGGLYGIQQGLNELHLKGQQFVTDRATLENKFNDNLRDLKKEIKDNGLDAALAKYSQKDDVIGFHAKEVQARVLSLRSKIAKLAPEFDIPAMDEHFEADFENLRSTMLETSRKQYINDCVTGAKHGVAIPIDQVLNSLAERVKMPGDALESYKRKIINAITADTELAVKLEKLKNLENNELVKGQHVVSYTDGDGNKVTESVYDLYQKTIASCQASYAQDNTTKLNTGGSATDRMSVQKRMERAKSYLDDLKAEHQSAYKTLEKEFNDRFYKCKDIEMTANTCSGATIFATTAQNFCFPNADTCAQKTTACYEQALSNVTKLAGPNYDPTKPIKAGLIGQKINEYNAKVEQVITDQHRVMKRIQGEVERDQEFMARYFKDTNLNGGGKRATYEVNESMFIPMPELESLSEYGNVLLRGGDADENMFEHLANKMNELKDGLADQQQQVEGVIDSYIAGQNENIKANIDYWKNLEKTCVSTAKAIQKQAAKQQALAQKQRAENDQKVGNFCDRFNALAQSNPTAGCDEAASELYQDSMAISSQLSQSERNAVLGFRNACAQSQSQRTRGSEDDGPPSESILMAEMCKNNGHKDSRVIKDVLANLTESLPEGLTRSDVTNYVNKGKESRRLKEHLDSGFGDALKSLRGFKEESDELAERSDSDPSAPITKQQFKDAYELLGGSSVKPNEDHIYKLQQVINKIHENKAKIVVIKVGEGDNAEEVFNEQFLSGFVGGESPVKVDKDNYSKLIGQLEEFKNRDAKSGGSLLGDANLGDIKSEVAGVISGKATSSGGSDKEAKRLAEMKRDFERNLKGSDSKPSLCAKMNNDAIFAAARTCKGKSGDAVKCIRSEYKDELEDSDQMAVVGRTIASVNDAQRARAFSQIGENTHGRCTAGANVGRNTNPFVNSNPATTNTGSRNGLIQ